MIQDELRDEYFEWMCEHVYDDHHSKKVTYHKLLHRLDEITFQDVIPIDGNRAEDGMDLRYRFAYEKRYGDGLIATYLDDRPCSVLEMMVALAIRCEEHIMEDPDIGDRTGQWFWNMIVSLGLGSMTDAKFDLDYVDDVIDRFMQRDFEYNGKGGLFTVENPRRDMRNVDIWYQMCFYLDDQDI